MRITFSNRRKRVIALAAGILTLVCAGAYAAYDLSWFTVDGGGGVSTGGGYSLTGVIGQPDAGTMSGPGYFLQGGFLPGAIEADNAAQGEWSRYK